MKKTLALLWATIKVKLALIALAIILIVTGTILQGCELTYVEGNGNRINSEIDSAIEAPEMVPKIPSVPLTNKTVDNIVDETLKDRYTPTCSG